MATPNESPNGKAPTNKEVHERVQTMMAELADKVQGKVKNKSLPDDKDFSQKFRFVWDWITATQIRGTREKDSARIILSVEESTWRATLSDPALKCSLTGVGLTFEGALDALEKLMGGAEIPWTLWKTRGKALRDIGAPEEK